MKIIIQILSQKLRPSKELLEKSRELSKKAHLDGVTLFFFVFYFLDSFLIFLPADGLLSLTLLWATHRMRPWVLAAVAGSMSGYLLFYVLSLTSFQPLLFDLLREHQFLEVYQDVIKITREYGYVGLISGVLTFVPPVIALVAGVSLHLQPFLIFVIVSLGKTVRIFVMIYLMRILKTSIVGLRDHWLVGKKAEKRVD